MQLLSQRDNFMLLTYWSEKMLIKNISAELYDLAIIKI